MKKNILGIILVIFLLFVLFLIKEKFTQAQSSIGIELYVYPQGFYGGGLMRIAAVTKEGKEGIYKNKRYSSVIAGTEYKLVIKNVGTNQFTLGFQLKDHYPGGVPVTQGIRTFTGTCSDFKGRLTPGGNCEIIGTFQEPSHNWQLWTISLNNSSAISFYLVKQSYAQNIGIASRDDQYYLEPTSTTTQPTSTINYTVYSNKLYCPSYMASGTSTVVKLPDRSLASNFSQFNVASSSFLINDSVSKTLELNGVSAGEYELYLVNSSNQRIGPPSPVQVTIKVQPPFTPPPGAFECPGASGNWCRCVFSYCYWHDPNTGKWLPTSSSVCGNVCAGGIRE
ncbi:MAG: hypothetical protein ACO2O4_02190 [Minisyncoccia bacterium]